MARDTISAVTARRIALAAQGFGGSGGETEGSDNAVSGADDRTLLRAIRRMGLLQIDSVSAVVRAHYMPLFSRHGAYDRAALDGFSASRPRRLFEYWAHEASLLPVETQPLLRWRMERARAGTGIYTGLARFGAERRPFIDAMLARIEREGPIAASEVEGEKGDGGWWGWSDAKRALEWLFWAGLVTTSARRGFERLYDLPERVLPRRIALATTPSPEDAQRELMRIAAAALGIATLGDLRDYFRLSPGDARPRLDELVEEATLRPVTVQGWKQQAYIHRSARVPRRIEATALLAPFDPLVFERSRTERLFDFHYRIEIYVPAARRRFGYYVLPFLLDGSIVGRCDLRADRPASVLRVIAVHWEPGAPAHACEALAGELVRLAAWLGLGRIAIEDRSERAAGLDGGIARISMRQPTGEMSAAPPLDSPDRTP